MLAGAKDPLFCGFIRDEFDGTAGYCVSGLGANTCETWPIIKVDQRNAAIGNYRITAPDFQPERGSSACRNLRKRGGFGRAGAICDAKKLVLADAVEFDDVACQGLLQKDRFDSTSGETGLKSGHALRLANHNDIVRAKGVKITAFNKNPGSKIKTRGDIGKG